MLGHAAGDQVNSVNDGRIEGSTDGGATSARTPGGTFQAVMKVKDLKKRHPHSCCIVFWLFIAAVFTVVMLVALGRTPVATGRPF